uniref:TF-B3 domain-containing protein n=1 Tax=Salix viminalis TaxID=40686 RepID=A0A6N2N9U6_SALVM
MVNVIRRPCFFVIFSSNLSSERLRIPVSFIKYMEGKTSGLVSLLGPSGDVWTADLNQENEGVLFSNGWSEFVRDHFLECGDLLVFRYHGELCFSVQVFDQSACEKEAAFHSKCSQGYSEFCGSIGQRREREEEAASLEKDFFCARKKVIEGCSEFHSEYIEKDREAHISACDVGGRQHDGLLTTEESISRETNQCGNPANCFATPSQSTACSEKRVPIWKRFGKDDDLKLHDRGHVSIFSEREKRVAESFISCFPYFVRIMKRFNVSGSYTLNIPYQFSMAHLPNCRTEIILRIIKGACWSVNSVPTTRVHTSHTLCGGWMAFVRSNEINVGDVCIFELVCKYEFRVFILRVGKEGPDMETQKVVSNGENTGSASTAHKTESFPKKSRRKCLKVHSKLIKKAEICDKKEFKKSQATGILRHGNATKDSACAVLCSMSRTGDGKQQALLIQNGKGVEAEAGLRRLVALDEERAAKSFTSGFPNFVRIMRKFNVSGSYTLKIPHQFSAAYLPNCKTEVILRNLQGQCWAVNSLPDSKGRAVHTFCGGWIAFVRDNNIKIGDICMFELVGKCQMRVQISGVGHEVANHQIGNPASNDLPLLAVPQNDPPLLSFFLHVFTRANSDTRYSKIAKESGDVLQGSVCCSAFSGFMNLPPLIFHVTARCSHPWSSHCTMLCMYPVEMGEETCEDCRSWEEELYWTHFQCTRFSHILSAGFDHQLPIPETFSNHLKKKLLENVTLKGPSGSTWQVELATDDDTMFFKHGWEEFVKDHFLEENDLLIFKYNGESNFDVLIFDGQSLCEKAASYFVRKCGHREGDSLVQTKRKTVEDSVEVTYTCPHNGLGGTPEKSADGYIYRTPVRNTVVSKAIDKKTRREIKFGKPIQTRKSVRYEGPSSTAEEIETKPDVRHVPIPIGMPDVSIGRIVTEEDKLNALRFAQTAQTNDGFVVIMKPTHVIPSAWSTRHFRTLEKKVVILRVKENTWNTNFLYDKYRNSEGLSSGWKSFALDNNLQEFDVCLFEPSGTMNNSIVLYVHIFRVL